MSLPIRPNAWASRTTNRMTAAGGSKEKQDFIAHVSTTSHDGCR